MGFGVVGTIRKQVTKSYKTKNTYTKPIGGRKKKTSQPISALEMNIRTATKKY